MGVDAFSPGRAKPLSRAAGLGYLVIIVCGIFAEFFVRSSLIVPGDAGTTAGNIAGAQGLFRLAIFAEFLMLAADVALAMLLYVLFREAGRSLALLAAFFRLTHASIVGVTLLNLFVPLLLLGDKPYLEAFQPEQLHALVLLILETHGFGYLVGLVFFGFHCLVLGYLVYRSGYVPKVLGVLLVVAGLGYLADGFGRTLLVHYDEYATTFQMVVFIPAFIGELSFCLWLLVKGVAWPTRDKGDER